MYRGDREFCGHVKEDKRSEETITIEKEQQGKQEKESGKYVPFGLTKFM